MRIVDCHVHVGGQADAKDVLGPMDASGVDRVILISPSERTSLATTRENLLTTQRLFDAAPDRLSGLAWVNPTIDGMADLAAEAVETMGFAGIKIIPDHYTVCDERLDGFWERMNALEARLLFHTGILYGFEDGSRFCRPVYLERLLHWPKIRFAMAHISWPWCEECLAVMGRMRAAAGYDPAKWQSYVDITPGTPPHIRRQALANAIDFCGPERIMFGTDGGVPGGLDRQGEHVRRDVALFEEFGLTARQIERIMSGTADEVFPPSR